MNKELKEIRGRVRLIGEREGIRLYRIARNMQMRGCSSKTIREIREEADVLWNGAYPERLLDPDVKWKYAFKY